ncbi:MAG: nucleotidyltransferase family protein [FCB group bacterium]|nr:nucleotidyltransferase family protein [FCB group bacterium]
MGQTNKLLLEYKRHTVIDEVVKQLTGSQVDRILIITGFEHSRIENLLTHRVTDRIRIVYNDNYGSGRAESIKCAIRHLPQKSDAVLFMVGDKPTVSTDLIDRAIELFISKKPPLLYVQTPTGRGHPIIFSRKIFDDLLLLEGDQIGNDLVDKYKDDLIALPDDNIQIDIDEEKDYRRLLKGEIGNMSS